MRQRRSGVIVNMSSGAALEASDSMGAYAGAKAGLDGMHLFFLHQGSTQLTLFQV